MVTTAVVLTVVIDLKRSGTYRSGFVRTLSRFCFAASWANRISSVLWVSPTLFMCAGVWSSHAAGGFPLTATLITSGYAIILTLDCTSSKRVFNRFFKRSFKVWA